ncbi:type II toxin-antitoxin system PemK/MazF family toxin [Thermosynechococcaceae cyanobacterium BACA0444]|uniref:Type II toxin-antitoxin system PemK/MazF family toxin n=1 Tax=Pseudocalidococcus azoricus BACA0444 TaxID=2918990 RepID=A0AAE4JVG2_9CYAN|nr:type II toxin-antitoxin system PemK/MazF family toxin [Pseudocalidococcus azoricus]MDS3859961.1 type II toxin-antitoxin system PemK/MazF family toxin [Pseudocalidococcus azoricus BACA0444]
MATFIKGDVVVVPFPFSDLTNAKRRPALVMAELDQNDLILCVITSRAALYDYITPINDSDFETGSLNRVSYAKSNRIFTANEQIIGYKIGKLKSNKVQEIVEKLIIILQR